MIKLRKAGERGHADHGWLDSWHTFSFADYHDPAHMGFRSLRVINDDRIAGGGGFGMHPHRDMEIVTWVLDGALEHRDSLGNGSVLRPGEMQRMTAGTGIRHSEFNHSATQPVHLLQIWILPEKPALEPSYEEKSYAADLKPGQLRLLVSPDARDGSVKIHQDVSLYVARLEKDQSVTHELRPKRHAWVQVARGEVTLNGQNLGAGDAAALTDETNVSITANDNAEVLLFDLK